MRVLVVFGTRPEIIKLAPVCRAMQSRGNVQCDIFWSGQHLELAAGLLEFFDLTVTYSGSNIVEQSGLAGKLGGMAHQIEGVLHNGAYDWVVVQGDTATAVAAATAAFLNKVPVAHVEAGLRTGDMQSPFPEEFNRRVIALAAQRHFPPTRKAAENLAAENVPTANIHTVGNTVIDALVYARDKLRRHYTPIEPALRQLPADKKLVLATLHRRENFGDPLRQVLAALADLADDGDKLVVLPVHLNPTVRQEVERILKGVPNIALLEPLQYPDFVYLLSKAWAVVTDSGGVQEEAPSFHLPVIITRESTERPEVIDAGFGKLVGCDRAAIVEAVRAATKCAERLVLSGENPFGDGSAAERICDLLTGRDRGVVKDLSTMGASGSNVEIGDRAAAQPPL